MKNIPVFYNPKQSLERVVSFSKSPNKPRLLAEHWLRLKKPIKIYDVRPVELNVYKQVHEPQYVDGIFAGKIANGFGNRDKDVLATLPFLTGSVVDAGIHVMETEDSVAFSLSSGSHHSSYNSNFGFCTMNHNMAALYEIKKRFDLKKVGVIDVDHHYNCGDHSIKNKLGLDWLRLYSMSEDYGCRLSTDEIIEVLYPTCMSFEGYDLILIVEFPR